LDCGAQVVCEYVDLQIEGLVRNQVAPATGRAVHQDRRLLHTERVLQLTPRSWGPAWRGDELESVGEVGVADQCQQPVWDQQSMVGGADAGQVRDLVG